MSESYKIDMRDARINRFALDLISSQRETGRFLAQNPIFDTTSGGHRLESGDKPILGIVVGTIQRLYGDVEIQVEFAHLVIRKKVVDHDEFREELSKDLKNAGISHTFGS